VRHRNFNIGPDLYPWQLVDAGSSAALSAARHEFDQFCQGNWTPLKLSVPERLDAVPFRQMATLEIQPSELLIKNGFPFNRTVTQDDFPAVVAAIRRSADAELGPGAGSPAARPGETSRYHP
jgi:hypothetical protein